ncbi:D-alanyl-D-alanine carboxypeptidase, putative [Babesia ovata]|uniref:D-alanyl-D-alanine carboxypeptidase, putative n=1 Tax=Babesia ovata TaxID=189622 RepID=A0A2H6K9C7_9APIC|nr:D-alanyl-D-alanine carboxypeptidase, putative [Babesia ovata]GBE59597.1 D-alanyl-D-alanine carboxypeptidase, putative [Babesia ovata]
MANLLIQLGTAFTAKEATLFCSGVSLTLLQYTSLGPLCAIASAAIVQLLRGLTFELADIANVEVGETREFGSRQQAKNLNALGRSYCMSTYLEGTGNEEGENERTCAHSERLRKHLPKTHAQVMKRLENTFLSERLFLSRLPADTFSSSCSWSTNRPRRGLVTAHSKAHSLEWLQWPSDDRICGYSRRHGLGRRLKAHQLVDDIIRIIGDADSALYRQVVPGDILANRRRLPNRKLRPREFRLAACANGGFRLRAPYPPNVNVTLAPYPRNVAGVQSDRQKMGHIEFPQQYKGVKYITLKRPVPYPRGSGAYGFDINRIVIRNNAFGTKR